MVRWTFILLAVIFITFIIQLVTDKWIYFAFTPAYAFSMPWTFVTSIFLHAGFTHLLFNMFALFIFGIYLESRIKPRDFLLIFFLAGIIGNFGYMLTAGNSTTPGIGASGAIYGIMGALAALVPFAVVYVWGMVPMPMILLAIVWTVTEVLGLFYPSNIARGAHLGGLFLGVIYGLYLKSKYRRTKRVNYIFYRE